MKLRRRIAAWSDRIRAYFSIPDSAWHGAAIGVYILGAFVFTFYFTVYILQDFAPQKLPAYVAQVSFFMLTGVAGLLLAALIMTLPAVYRAATALIAPAIVMSAVPGGTAAAVAAGLGMVLLVSLVGGAIGVYQRDGFSLVEQKGATAALLIGAAGLVGGGYTVFSDKASANPFLDDYALEDRTLDLPNPGLPGPHEVLTLTYGSGKDRHRAGFGDEVDVVSRTVDGSGLIDNWDGLSGWLRTSYWGFDSTALPLQARVWYPSGDGPFPLVLVVHGNHSMEDFSDPGYDYLGELFASRGIVLASVDENFINSSMSARVEVTADRPGLKEENDARGWLLLQHLAQWRDWNREPGHRFNGMIDMDRVALIGHSRGGEAVGIAAAFNTLDRYPDDALVDFDFGFNLRGVIAIAPVYGQYEPRERPTPVENVNYFTIHGDMDGDVQSFEGIAQYSRVRFSGDDYRFRSSLYVVGANHGQFNTTWENLDTSLYRAWALDLDGIMDGEAQRDVARVYFGAFMEAVLNGKVEYLPIFRDARYAASWLPDTFYINQFSDSTEKPIIDFEEDIDPTTFSGGRIETENLSKWFEKGNELKYDELDTHSMVVAWDDRFSKDTARLDFLLDTPETADFLIATISAIDIDTLPDDFESDDETVADPRNGEEADNNRPLDWTIEVAYENGASTSFPLSSDSALFPLINAVPRRAGFLDDAEPVEILFRRFEFAVGPATESDAGPGPGGMTRVSFIFDRSARGAIIIDEISIGNEGREIQ